MILYLTPRFVHEMQAPKCLVGGVVLALFSKPLCILLETLTQHSSSLDVLLSASESMAIRRYISKRKF
jgi:hypothetical protein